MAKIQPCPRCDKKENVIRKGFYRRACDCKRVQKFHCKTCDFGFSLQTYKDTYRMRRVRLIPQFHKGFISATAKREISTQLHVSRATTVRFRDLLFVRSLVAHAQFLKMNPDFKELFVDEIITKEFSKCLPLSLPIVVSRERFILSLGVARIPAFGHLAKISRKKYGERPDESQVVMEAMFDKLREYLRDVETIISDEKTNYGPLVRKHFPGAQHVTHKGAKACVAGQGEMKKKGFDPLFAVNHTNAMARDRIANLKRRTWTTTKIPESLLKTAVIYIHSHNTRLCEKLGGRKVPSVFRALRRNPKDPKSFVIPD